MKKLFILIFVLIMCIGIVSAGKDFAEVQKTHKIADTDTIKQSKNGKVEDLAYTKVKDLYVSQIPNKIDKNTEALLTIKQNLSESKYDICYDFPVSNTYFNFEYAKKDNILWFSDDLLENTTKQNNRICLNSMDSGDINSLKYKLGYLGRGTIKFNITIIPSKYNKDYAEALSNDELLVLDPYLVGDLNQSTNLLMYLPFVNSSASRWDSIYNMFPLTNTRSNVTKLTASYVGGNWVNPTQAYDENYGTYGGVYGYNCPSGNIMYNEFSKLPSDTGAVWQNKYGVLNDRVYPTKYSNITIPNNCFNAQTTKISVAVSITPYQYDGSNCCGGASCSSTYQHGATFDFYCYDGASYNSLLHDVIHDYYTIDNVGGEYYEGTMFITNSSNFVSYDQTILPVGVVNNKVVYNNISYINNSVNQYNSFMNGIAGYDFAMNNNSNDTWGINNGVNTLIKFNSSGANLNNSNSLINLSKISHGNELSLFTTFTIKSTPSDYVFMAQTNYSSLLTDIEFGIGVVANTMNFACVNSILSMTLELNKEYTIGCVYNNTNVSVYLNGALYGSTLIGSSIGNQESNFYIGRTRTGVNSVNSTIRNLYIFNRSLTAQEILQLNNSNTSANIYQKNNYTGLVTGWLFAVYNSTYPINDGTTYIGNASASVIFNLTGANFNGVNGQVNISRIKRINNWSMYVEFKKNNQDAHGILWTNRSTGFPYLFSDSGTSLSYDGSSSAGAYSCNGINPTGWNKVVISQNISDYIFYFDGVKKCSVPITSLPLENNGIEFDVIGWFNGGGSNELNGTIKSLLVYDRTLSDIEAITLTNQYQGDTNVLNESNGSMIFTNNQIYLPIASKNWTLNTPYTISTWFKSPYTTQENWIYSDLKSNAWAGLFLYTNYENIIFTEFGASGQSMVYTSYNSSNWNHLVAMWNGTYTKLYLNGELKMINNWTENTTPVNPHNPFMIGGTGTDYVLNRYVYDGYTGSLSQFMLFSGVLTDSQIYTLANGYYPLNWINITTCSSTDQTVLTYNLKDQQNQTSLSGTMNVNINLVSTTDPTKRYNYTAMATGSTLNLCLPNSIFSVSNFIMNASVEYYSTNAVTQHNYIINTPLNSTTTPITVNLYDLNTYQSTDFTIQYQDSVYNYVEGAFIDLQRKYFNNGGQFISVEHAFTNQDGQTLLHMDTNSVIYKINVWVNGSLVYSTPETYALCQTSPCVINLNQPSNETPVTSIFGNINYQMSNNTDVFASNNIQFNYSTIDNTPVTMQMIVTKTTSSSSIVICNTNVTSSSGALNCSIPVNYQNATYVTQIIKNNDSFGVRSYNQLPKSNDIFGSLGIIITAFVWILFILMGISNPIIALVLGAIGFIMMVLLNIINGGNIIGIASTGIWLLVAIALLIYKFQERRGI